MSKYFTGREAYRDELSKLATHESKIVCLETDLAGYDHPFAKNHPKNFFNLGIGELAAIDIAAGIAKSGFIPFYSTFAGFATLRALEAMKLYQGYMGLNIKIVCPYAGVSGSFFGTTHQCLEDLAIVQVISGLKIAAPYGEEETREVIQTCVTDFSPYYVRLGRSGRYKSLPSADNRYAEQGMVGHVIDRSKMCLISVGEEGTRLCKEVITYEDLLIDHIHLKYLHLDAIKKAMDIIAKKYEEIFIIEEARPQGSVASTIALHYSQRLKVHSFNCGEKWLHTGGNHQQCLEKLGFSAKSLIDFVKMRIQS